MKTLDEIINRQDYMRANAALVKRAEQLAIIFRDKMCYLGMNYSPADESRPRKGMSIIVNKHRYTVRKKNWYSNGEFLNDAKDILKALDDIETNRVIEIKNAIDNSKDIAV